VSIVLFVAYGEIILAIILCIYIMDTLCKGVHAFHCVGLCVCGC